MEIENILFDLDGTLINSVAGIQFAVERAVSTILPQQKISDLEVLIGPPIGELLKQILTDISPEILDEILQQFREIYDREGWQLSLPYEGVLSGLTNLHQLQVKQWIVTNKPILPTRKILEHLHLSELFTDIFTPDYATPHFASKVDMVADLIDRYKLKPSSTLLVGDSYDDALAAFRSNIPFAAATYGYGRVHLNSNLPITHQLVNFRDLFDRIIIATNQTY
jgi:phosphoglycolate phosphatase